MGHWPTKTKEQALLTPLCKSGSSSEKNKSSLISQNQFGHRRRKSKDVALVILIDTITKEIDEENIVGVIFMDLSKAFDTDGHYVRKAVIIWYNRR